MNAERYIDGVGFVPFAAGENNNANRGGAGVRGIFKLRINFNVTPQIKRYVYVYVVAEDHVYLIDTGVKGSEKDVIELLGALGRDVADIKAIFLTHSHPDHIGAASELVRLSDARVYACAEEREWIENIAAQFRDRPIPNFFDLVGGSVNVDETVRDGDVITPEPHVTLRAVATHGHSAGSTSYVYIDRRVAFIGDAVPVRGDIPIYVSVADSLATLDILGAVGEADCICPAWDSVYTPDEFRGKLSDARALISGIDACVRCERAAAPDARGDEIFRRACEKLNMTSFAANPLFLRSLNASLMPRNGGLVISKATAEDLPAIFNLQMLAFESLKKIFDKDNIPPLKQTLRDLAAEFEKGIVLKALMDGETVGSVRAYSDGETVYVGKLIVRPDRQGQGIGTKLLLAIERYFPQKRFELFTSTRSTLNIKLYERLGYKRYKEAAVNENLSFVYMEKLNK